MSSRLRFGIVGAGMIANVVAEAIRDAGEADLAAVASRRREGAEDFAGRHGVPRVFDTWRELVASEAVDAVYVATPTAVREEIGVAAAQNEKHVLADKPFASLGSLRRITAACRDRGVAFMDATHFVHHPRTAQLKRELEGRIGRVQAVRTCFFFPSMDRGNIRFDPAKEPTGAIGDMAWYSMRAIVEYMPGEGELAGAGGFAQRDEETGAVVRGSGFLAFSDGRTSTWDAGYSVGALVMDLDLLGDEGTIRLDDFVLDWAGGFAPGDPDYAVGFTQRSGVMTPGELEFVATPSGERATVLMIRDFVALTGDPAGEAAAASIYASERTQGLVDAVWAACVTPAP